MKNKDILCEHPFYDGKCTTCQQAILFSTKGSINYEESIKYVRSLTGKNLTLLEACITDEKQLKALKDCVRNNTADCFASLSKLAFGEVNLNILPSPDEIKEISLEDAIGV